MASASLLLLWLIAGEVSNASSWSVEEDDRKSVSMKALTVSSSAEGGDVLCRFPQGQLDETYALSHNSGHEVYLGSSSW